MATPKPILLADEPMRQRVVSLIQSLDLSKPWEISVGRPKKRRTLSQNSLMWAWLNEVANYVQEHTGMDADEVHAFFKAKFLKPSIIELNGQTAEYRTTTKLTAGEMSAYMDRIYAFCTSELGLLLPLPIELQDPRG